MFELLAQLSQDIASKGVTEDIKQSIDKQYDDISRMYSIALLLKLTASGCIEEPGNILELIKTSLDPDYYKWYVNICHQNVATISDSHIDVMLHFIERDSNNDHLLLKVLGVMCACRTSPSAFQRLWNANTSLKSHILSLLFHPLANRVYEDHEKVIRDAHRDVVRAHSMIHANITNHSQSYQLPLEDVAHMHVPTMYTNYYDSPCKQYRVDIASCMMCLCPQLKYEPPAVSTFRNARPRIGYVSFFFHVVHAVMTTFEHVIRHAPGDVDVVVFMCQDTGCEYIKDFKQHCNSCENIHIHVFNNTTIQAMREEILAYQLDVLVYPEVTEQATIYALSFSRLARVQVASIGHSTTSGVPTIDYYISSKVFEPENAQQNYSEKLIQLNGAITYYKQFRHEKRMQTREELGLGKFSNAIIFACLQTCLKLSRSFLETAKRILDAVPNSYILLLEPQFPNFKSTIDEILGDRIIYTSNGKSHDEYMNFLMICDIALCPFPFGGYITSYDCFFVNIPTVTLEGKYLMGRLTSGLYKKMGFTDCIAHSSEEYYSIAMRLVNDVEFYRRCKITIHANVHKIFACRESLDEWYDCLRMLSKS